LDVQLDLTTTHRQTRLFSSTSTYHSTDLLTARGIAHGTSGSTSYETIPPVRLETSGGVLLTMDMVMQRRDARRQLRDDDLIAIFKQTQISSLPPPFSLPFHGHHRKGKRKSAFCHIAPQSLQPLLQK